MKLLKNIGRWITSIFRKKKRGEISAETIEWIQKVLIGIDNEKSENQKAL